MDYHPAAADCFYHFQPPWVLSVDIPAERFILPAI